MAKNKKYLNLSFILILSLIVFFSIYSYFTKGVIFHLITKDTTSIINFLNSFGNLSIFIFIFLVILEVLFAMIPPFVLYLVGGILFGSFFGGIYALLGNVIGAGIAFQISKNWVKDFVKRKISADTKKKFGKISQKHGPLAVFFLRLNPFTSSDLINYIAGISNINFWKFLISTALGLVPLIFIQSYLGQSISENPLIYKVVTIISLLYAFALIMLFIYIKLKRKKQKCKVINKQEGINQVLKKNWKKNTKKFKRKCKKFLNGKKKKKTN